MKNKKLYLVSGWVPFPSSEYGALYCVLADNDKECEGLLLGNAIDDDYDCDIPAAIANGDVFNVTTDKPSGIVQSFVT